MSSLLRLMACIVTLCSCVAHSQLQQANNESAPTATFMTVSLPNLEIPKSKSEKQTTASAIMGSSVQHDDFSTGQVRSRVSEARMASWRVWNNKTRSRYIFIGPYEAAGGGAYIYDKFGNLVWDGFGITGPTNAHDFRPCQYKGSQHLCFSSMNQQNGYGVGNACKNHCD